MTNSLRTFSTRKTSQSQPASADQVKNNAGGYTFSVSPVERVRRFLVLGSEGSYYASGVSMTRDNAKAVIHLAETDHKLLVDTIVDISDRGAAPKNDPALFALALAASIGTSSERGYALDNLHKVARTGTHLFAFCEYVQQFRGWGRALRYAVGEWYSMKPADTVAYQATKYRQRNGWTHRDVLRKSHPEVLDPGMLATFDWITKGSVSEHTPRIIEGFLKAQEAKNSAEVAQIVRDYGLSWEMLPDFTLSSAETWGALLDNGMPLTALMRQLPRLTNLGVLPAWGGYTAKVAERFTDVEGLKKARIHPVNVLMALRVYAQGYNAHGTNWTPTQKIVDALDAGFYAAFGAVEPAGKRTMLALDVSGSMGAPVFTGNRRESSPLSCRDAAAALSLVTLATEPQSMVYGFTSNVAAPQWSGGGFDYASYHKAMLAYREKVGLRPIAPLNISPRQRLDDVLRYMETLPFGGTDCALPMVHALKEGLEVDTFIVYTDNETWAGEIQPHQALKQYREKTGINAKLIVVGLSATEFTIADPKDPGMLDVAGFDTAVPNLITEFSKGLAN